MILQELQQHQWKSVRRHPLFDQTLYVKAFTLFAIFVMLAYLMVLGFFLDKICVGLSPYKDPAMALNSILLYLFMIDFAIKFIVKGNKPAQLIPYLTLPVKKQTLFNFILFKEFISVWNFWLVIFLIPFSLKVLIPAVGIGGTFFYLFCIYLLSLISSYLSVYCKYLYQQSVWYLLLPIGVFAAIIYMAIRLKIPFGDYSCQFGDLILQTNIMAPAALLFFLFATWQLNCIRLRKIIYKCMEGEQSGTVSTIHMGVLEHFGKIGEMIMLDLKQTWRGKRLRMQLFSAVYLVCFGFYMFFTMRRVGQEDSMSSIMLPAFTLLSYGTFSQFIFLAESTYFDGLMSRPIYLLNLLKARYYTYTAVCTIMLAVLLTFSLFYAEIKLLTIVAVYFYIIGVVFASMFQLAPFAKSRFDIYEKAMGNYKGVTGGFLIKSMFFMMVPVALVMIVNYFAGFEVALYFMLVAGITGMLLHNHWLTLTYKRFYKRRYANMDGYRNS